MDRNQEGRILSKDYEVIENWSYYLKDLMNFEEVSNEDTNIPEDGMQIEEPTFEEVEQALIRIEINKCL